MKFKDSLIKVVLVVVLVMAFSFEATAAGTKWRLQHSWGAAENHFFEHYAKIVKDIRIPIIRWAQSLWVSWKVLLIYLEI